MPSLLRDPRIYRILGANALASLAVGVTMIAVPWILVQQPGGEALFGYATALLTLVLVFFLPYYGWLVDRFPRKRMLLAAQLFALGSTAVLAAAAWVHGKFEPWHLVGLYSAGTVYWTIHYPALFALNQEIFPREQYAELASYAEIQGQTASVVSGALAALLLDRAPLGWITGGSLVAFVGSLALFASVPYAPLVARAPSGLSAWAQVAEGVRFFTRRPRFGLFLAAAFVPFIGIMIGNYLFPIYAHRTLGASAWVFAAGEITFAVGAIGAGFTIPLLMRARGSFRTVALAVGVCAASAALLAAWPAVALYLVLNATLGWGNAGARVARSTILLRHVPNALIGRVNVLFNLFERIVRTLALGAITGLVTARGPQLGFGLVAGLTGVALLAVLLTRDAVPAEELAPGGEAVPAK